MSGIKKGSKKGVVFGIAINDLLGVVKTSAKEYKLWYSIIRRAYSDVYHNDKPKYKDVSVSEDWLLFSNFYKDIKTVENFEKSITDGWALDKDILFKGNRLYSKDTVCFVPPEINSIFIRANKKDGKVIGVSKRGNGFYAVINMFGKQHDLGNFRTEDEAFLAFKNAKENYICGFANKYKLQLANNVYNALINYSVDKYD